MNAKWPDFAVLYRSNVQSRALESVFRVAGIPYKVVGGYEFFDRKEIKDLVAYLKVILNPHDDLSLLRILNYPRRGIGDRTIVALSDQAKERNVPLFDYLLEARNDSNLTKQNREGLHSFTELIESVRAERHTSDIPKLVRAVIEGSGYREEIQRTIDDAITAQMKIDMVEELASAAASYVEQEKEGTLRGFIDTISLNDDPSANGNQRKQSEDAVLLATLHSAKGLEFPYVFLCGMEEELFPHARSMKDNANVDEERRLCYVGITRARRHLTLSFVKERNQYGRRVKRTPSRFLRELPEELLCKQFSHSPHFFDKQKKSTLVNYWFRYPVRLKVWNDSFLPALAAVVSYSVLKQVISNTRKIIL